MALFKTKKGPSFAEIQAARNVTPEKMALMAIEEDLERAGIKPLTSFVNMMATASPERSIFAGITVFLPDWRRS